MTRPGPTRYARDLFLTAGDDADPPELAAGPPERARLAAAESAAPLIRAGSPASGTHPRRPRSGLISANAGNDAGGIITYASARSQLGYRMLFLMVLITMALVVVQEMCSRLGAYTQQGLGALIREQFPLRRGAPRCCSCSSPTRD